MAKRRMFALKVTSSDAFTDMPLSTQALYFHLGMVTDDDGFVTSPRRTQRAIGASDDDMKILVTKGFVIPFPSGVLVITHHLLNNTLRNDRHKPTLCEDEFNQLEVLSTEAYHLLDGLPSIRVPDAEPAWQPGDNQLATNGTPNRTEHNLTEPNKNENASAVALLAEEVVGYLNAKVGSRFRSNTKETVRAVSRWASEGYRLEDFRHVVNVKVAQWGDDPNMARYLRPKTLFGPNFESYLNEKEFADDYTEYDE